LISKDLESRGKEEERVRDCSTLGVKRNREKGWKGREGLKKTRGGLAADERGLKGKVGLGGKPFSEREGVLEKRTRRGGLIRRIHDNGGSKGGIEYSSERLHRGRGDGREKKRGLNRREKVAKEEDAEKKKGGDEIRKWEEGKNFSLAEKEGRVGGLNFWFCLRGSRQKKVTKENRSGVQKRGAARERKSTRSLVPMGKKKSHPYRRLFDRGEDR